MIEREKKKDTKYGGNYVFADKKRRIFGIIIGITTLIIFVALLTFATVTYIQSSQNNNDSQSLQTTNDSTKVMNVVSSNDSYSESQTLSVFDLPDNLTEQNEYQEEELITNIITDDNDDIIFRGTDSKTKEIPIDFYDNSMKCSGTISVSEHGQLLPEFILAKLQIHTDLGIHLNDCIHYRFTANDFIGSNSSIWKPNDPVFVINTPDMLGLNVYEDISNGDFNQKWDNYFHNSPGDPKSVWLLSKSSWITGYPMCIYVLVTRIIKTDEIHYSLSFQGPQNYYLSGTFYLLEGRALHRCDDNEEY